MNKTIYLTAAAVLSFLLSVYTVPDVARAQGTAFSARTLLPEQKGTGTARLFGEVVSPREADVEIWFEWGSSEFLARRTSVLTLPSGSQEPVVVSTRLANLSPGDRYFYRAMARTAGGTTLFGNTIRFISGGPAGAVTTHRGGICFADFGTGLPPQAVPMGSPVVDIPGTQQAAPLQETEEERRATSNMFFNPLSSSGAVRSGATTSATGTFPGASGPQGTPQSNLPAFLVAVDSALPSSPVGWVILSLLLISIVFLFVRVKELSDELKEYRKLNPEE